MTRKLPLHCPSCDAALQVESLRCPTCDTRVGGTFNLPPLARLSADDQRFVLMFLKASGSLKEVARQLGHSYPTVRNMLDDLILRVRMLEEDQPPGA